MILLLKTLVIDVALDDVGTTYEDTIKDFYNTSINSKIAYDGLLIVYDDERSSSIETWLICLHIVLKAI